MAAPIPSDRNHRTIDRTALFVSIGASGKFNHSVGLRAAGTVLAINHDAAAPIFEAADAGIVGDWRAVLPLLVADLTGADPTVVTGAPSRASQ